MTYLLDTCILSKLRKIPIRSDPPLEKWFSQHKEQQFYLSVLTLGEIHQGIYRLPKNIMRQTLEEWLYGSLIPKFQGRILPIDSVISLKWGELSWIYQKSGIPLPIADTLIAATGIVHDLIIVTENVRDFSKIEEAKIFNPWQVI